MITTAMTGAGRPLRFAAVMLCVWTAARAALMWVEAPAADDAASAGRAAGAAWSRGSSVLLPAPELAEGGPVRMTAALRAAIARSVAMRGRAERLASPTLARFDAPARHGTLIDVTRPGRDVDPTRVQLALLAAVHVASSDELVERYFADSPRLMLTGPAASRFSGSAWLLARGGGVPAVAGASQLGGGQAGTRLRYALNDDGLSAAAGAAVPLASRGREAMLAIEWQPADVPVRLVAEQRIALDDGISGGPGIGAVAGVGPTGIGGGFDIEGYGQTGAIARARLEPYAEGAARIARPVATIGEVRVDLGAGIWAGAQRDATRIDAGPAISAALPIAGQRFRVALDWRQRIAGDARPGSGPALSIGTDF